MHIEAMTYVTHALTTFKACDSPVHRVVDIGGRDVNGSPRNTVMQLFPEVEYTSIDIMPGPSVDVVADGCTYTPDLPADIVICCEVLEHCRQAQAMVTNAITMLRPGGLLVVTCAGEGRAPHSALHGGVLVPNEYYKNVTTRELESWLAPLPCEYTVTENRVACDTYATARRGM